MKFDDAGYHEAAAIEAGQPVEHGFTHMGLALAWAIRRDLVDPELFAPEHIDLVRSGSWTGSDLRDEVDGKLVSDMFTDDGAAFLAARYDAYLGAYTATFASVAEYSVVDDDAARAVVEPILDGLYRDWVAVGKPGPAPGSDDHVEYPEFELPDIDWQALPTGTGVQLNADGSWSVVAPPPARHDDVDMEARIRPALPPDADLASTTASHWGDSRLNRVLRDLGVKPKAVTVTHGMGGTGPEVVVTMAYRVPGAAADQLLGAFALVVTRPSHAPWTTRVIGPTTVAWADGTFDDIGDDGAVAYWAEDGLVLHVAGPVAAVETAIRALA
jgi:hypothetical protein